MQDWLHDFSFQLKVKKKEKNEKLLKPRVVFIEFKRHQEIFERPRFEIKSSILGC